MPHYYFHLVKGDDCIRDAEGLELTQALLPEIAVRVLGQIQVETPNLFDGGHDGWTLNIVDGEGQIVQTIQLSSDVHGA
jgi:hypothetical protein